MPIPTGMTAHSTVSRGTLIIGYIEKLEQNPKSKDAITRLGSLIGDYQRKLENEMQAIEIIKKRFALKSKGSNN